MNKKTITLLIGIAVVAAAIAYWDKISALFKKQAGGTSLPSAGSSTAAGGYTAGSTSGSSSSSAGSSNPNQVLKKNVYDSTSVRELQKLLNSWYGAGLAVDGDFGPQTEAALYRATGKYSITLFEFKTKYANSGIAGAQSGMVWLGMAAV